MKCSASLSVLLFCLSAFGANVTFNLADFTVTAITNRQVRIAPTTNPSTGPTNTILSRDTLVRYSDSTGSFTVTNMQQGNYLCTLLGSYATTPFAIYVPSTNGTLNASDLLTATNAFTAAYTGNTLWVDAVYGNDSSGKRGRIDRPFATPLGARRSALLGDLIVVGEGTYTNGLTNLLFNGSWEFHNPILDYMDTPTNTSGCGLFDDRFSGAVTNSVSGSLWIKWCSGTNVFVDPTDCTMGYNTNAFGPIIITNANTLIRWDASTRVELAAINSGAGTVLTVLNCRDGTIFRTFTTSQMFGTNQTIPITTNCAVDPGTQYYGDLYSSFLHWEKGTLDVEFDTVNHRQYGIESYSRTPTDPDQLRIRGNFMDGKIYCVGKSSSWKIWADILELQRSTTVNPNAIEIYYGGKYYFTFQKISCASSSSDGFPIKMAYPVSTTDSNLQVWVDIQKLSSSNTFLSITHGELRGRIGHMEQSGPVSTTAGGIIVTNISALVDLAGENIYSERTAVQHGGGRTVLRGYNIYSTNRDPILVTGSGLRLVNTVLVPGLLATNSIRAATAQTVGAYGMVMAKSNVHANITISTGTTNFTVAPSVD